MPAASSKPAPQTTPSDGQDTVKTLLGVVEKKIRNLEKRKTKLDGYREMVTSGKDLNKDQEEAVSHFEEVGASLEFAKELSKQFTTILNDATKAQKREAKREKQQRHEQDMGRISDVLLLQNILFHMGQEHVRGDFLAGTNGALHLDEQELTNLDEFFKLVSPSREDEEEGEEVSEENKSFDKKLEMATSHLNSYLKEEEKEVCSTTYKELFHLVQRVHNSGYLDNIPAPPEEAEPVVEEMPPVATAAPVAQGEDQEQEEEYEENFQEGGQEYVETLNEAPSESYFSGVPSDQMQQQQANLMQAAQTEMQSSEPHQQQQQQQQQQQTMNDVGAPSSRVHDMPHAPEPIEMPPPKPTHHDVNEVLAPVLGSFNFVQDSMLDYDSPHMDPAVVAVSQQPFIPSSTFANSVQSSTNSAEMSQAEQSAVRDHQTLSDTLAAQQQSHLPADQSYQQQTRYDASQQSYADQTSYASQTLEGGSSGFGGQADLSSTSNVQVEYGSSQTSTGGKLNELPEFPNAPGDTQQDQSVLQSSMLNQQSLSHSSTQYSSQGLSSSEGFQQSLGSNQLGNDGVSSSLTSSSPLTITDPSQATIPLPGEQTASDVQQGSIPPKSTMNASAPPFQMTNAMRSSPQMQTMQTSPPGQVGQSQDMGGYQGGLDQSQDFNHSGNRDVNRTHSPPQDGKMDHTGMQQSDQQGNSYSNYQPYYKNGRGGKPRGPNPNFRGSRGNAPFIRGGARYNAPQAPRGGPGGFNTYVHREAFAPRGPDMSYNPNARYGGFNQVQQEQSFYNRRGGGGGGGGGMPRGGPRGGRGGAPNPRNQTPYRGGRGSGGFGKPAQVSV